MSLNLNNVNFHYHYHLDNKAYDQQQLDNIHFLKALSFLLSLSHNNNNHNRIPIFDRQYDVDLTKGEPVVDPVYTIKRDYYFYFLYIYEDYLLNAYNSLQNYVMSCLNNIALGKLNDPVPEATSKAIKNKNLLNLTDYLTKSNINLEQTLRLHKKMFHLDETIYHLKSIRVSREQSLRYSAIKPKEVKSSQDIENNNILKESLDI